MKTKQEIKERLEVLIAQKEHIKKMPEPERGYISDDVVADMKVKLLEWVLEDESNTTKEA